MDSIAGGAFGIDGAASDLGLIANTAARRFCGACGMTGAGGAAGAANAAGAAGAANSAGAGNVGGAADVAGANGGGGSHCMSVLSVLSTSLLATLSSTPGQSPTHRSTGLSLANMGPTCTEGECGPEGAENSEEVTEAKGAAAVARASPGVGIAYEPCSEGTRSTSGASGMAGSATCAGS